jgi:RNA polymerase sigma factor (sigma-70 family)
MVDEIISEELIENTYLFCRKRIQDSEAAKDLSQDIILCALIAIRSGKSFTDFYGWYWRMARNKYADYLTARRNLPVELNMGMASDIPEPIEALISEEEISALNYSLSRLSSINRETVIRYYLKEQTVEEIARALKVPIGTVKRRLFDVRKNVKERIVNMNNTIGKTAYAPTKVNYFFGYNCAGAEKVISQKIAEQIAVIARSEPKTVNQISDEMGVAPVYVEDIVRQMVNHSLLKESGKGRYVTNFCVFPQNDYSKAESDMNRIFFEREFPKRITEMLYDLKDEITALDFYGNDFDYSYLLWLLYVTAGYKMGELSADAIIKSRYPMIKDEAERSYRITAMYLTPEETAEGYPYKGIGWSNLGQGFLTAKYGSVMYYNLFDAYPFIEKDGGRLNRSGWIDAGNVSLLIALSENPSMELNVNEQEQAAAFIEHGLVKKTENGLKVMLPIMSDDVYAKITEIIHKNIKLLAEEYGREAGAAFIDALLPYVRKDLMSNFLHWDVKVRMQEIPALFYYGIEEGKTLKLPQDYTRSAAGLLLTRHKA